MTNKKRNLQKFTINDFSKLTYIADDNDKFYRSFFVDGNKISTLYNMMDIYDEQIGLEHLYDEISLQLFRLGK